MHVLRNGNGRKLERQKIVKVVLLEHLRRVDLFQHTLVRVGVHALVQPGVFHLVIRDGAVPPLMPHFVNRVGFGKPVATGCEPARPAGHEHRVFHGIGLRIVRRINDGEPIVGVGTEPAPVVAKRLPDAREVAIFQGPMIRQQ